ncbi:MAG: flippase [Caldilineaceae bacterium]
MFKEARKVIKNFTSLVAGWFFIRLLSAGATMYIAKTLGPTDFGALAFGLSLALVFSVCANLGLDDFIIREVARQPNKTNRLLGDALMLKGFAAPLLMLMAFGLMMYKPEQRWLFLFLMLYSLLHSGLLLFGAVFQGLEQMELQTSVMLTEMILITTGSVLAVWLTHSATVVAACYLVATLVALGVGYGLLRKQGFRFEWRWQPTAWRQLLMTALPFSLIFIGQIFYDRLALTAIATLNGETAVGWFTAVYNITLVFSNFPMISVATLFPLLARLARQSTQTVATLGGSLVKAMLVISTFLAIALALWAPWIVGLLFGPAYQPSVRLLQMLALSVPPLFLSLTLAGILQATGHQRACALYTGYALLIALPVTLVATRFGGYQSGALAYVFNYWLVAGFMLRLTLRCLADFPVQEAIGWPLLAGVLAASVAYAIHTAPPVVVLLTIGAVYTICLWISGLFSTEFTIIRRFWQERTYANS